MKHAILLAGILVVWGGRSAAPQTTRVANLDDEAWPRNFTQGPVRLTIYQPQLETWNGLQLEGQAAVSIRQGEGEPTFGVMWFTARTIVNKPERLVTLEELTIVRTSFPSAADRTEEYTARLRGQLAGAPRKIALDRLEADLAILVAGRKAEGLPMRNDPPRILFSPTPALLVHVDGSPVYRAVQGTNVDRVVNTRSLILRDTNGRHFLHASGAWLEAPVLDGPWVAAKLVSRGIESARRQSVAAGGVEPLPGLVKGGAPTIHVATTPTELIVTEGEANWSPIGGATQLIYVTNTSGHVFIHMGDRAMYVLVSGRWFRGPSMAGPWKYVVPDALPPDFGRIPDESPKENVKASVPGTPQAAEALIANNIPQTASVDRKTAVLAQPKYDGEPQFRTIEGTSLRYVANTPAAIIVAGPNAYYAVEKGVWFVSDSLAGPWRVASSVPAVIYSIPPSSPMHFVTYVRVYSATPNVVYVGYTPGYHGTCVSRGVVVYGTGFVYTPWVGAVWYGAPVTYGFGANVTYTPWTGWAYYAPPAWGAALGSYGAAAWGPGGWAATTGSVYSRWGSSTSVSRTSGGYNAWTGNAWGAQAGTSYNSRTGVASAGQRAGVQNVYTGNYAAAERGVAQGPGGATAAGGRVTAGNAETGRSVTAGRGAAYDPNTGNATSVAGVRGADGGVGRVGDDVYAGKDGNVYRHGSDGWQQYENGGWQAVGDSARTGSLDQQRASRATGENRVQSLRQGRPEGLGANRPARGSRPRRR